jgi:hypothetical protein
MYGALWENKFQWPGRTIARCSLYFVTAIRFYDRQAAMADQPDYAVRAIHADEQAERAASPGLADWASPGLADWVVRGSQELSGAGPSVHRDENRRRQMRVPKVEDRDI